jgi:hypothetical protein
VRALRSAQKSIVDEANQDGSDNDEPLTVGRDQYKIVNSHLAVEGNYSIDERRYRHVVSRSIALLTFDVDGKTSDDDSSQSNLNYESEETLAALSHACLLINVIAFYLHISLPFRLHQL